MAVLAHIRVSINLPQRWLSKCLHYCLPGTTHSQPVSNKSQSFVLFPFSVVKLMRAEKQSERQNTDRQAGGMVQSLVVFTKGFKDENREKQGQRCLSVNGYTICSLSLSVSVRLMLSAGR